MPGAVRAAGPAASVSVKAPSVQGGPWRWAGWTLLVALYAAFTWRHFLTVPLLVTYDGHGYLELADVLGSERFPAEWKALRTPLLPLSLKLSFAAFGRNALAAQLPSLLLGCVGCLLVASTVRQLAGRGAAAAALAVTALYPVLVAFQHAVLTETGTFAFLALAVRLAVWRPVTVRESWWKAGALALALGAGFYWRQSLLVLAPWLGALHWLACRRIRAVSGAGPPRGVALLQALAVVAGCWLLVQPWTGVVDRNEVRILNANRLRTHTIRQAVLPAGDPRLAPVEAQYRRASDETRRVGARDGIAWHRVEEISSGLAPPLEAGVGPKWFAGVVLQYPGRYLAAVARTLGVFAGLGAREDELVAFTDLLVSPASRDSLMAPEPARLAERNREQLSRAVEPDRLRALLRAAAPRYESLLLACCLAIPPLAAVAAWRRDERWLAVCATPVVYALAHAVILMSIRRFMLPVYPLALAAATAGAWRLLAWLAHRVHRPIAAVHAPSARET